MARPYPYHEGAPINSEVSVDSTVTVAITVKDTGGFFTPADILNMFAQFVDSQNGLMYYSGRLTATSKTHVRYEPFRRERNQGE